MFIFLVVGITWRHFMSSSFSHSIPLPKIGPRITIPLFILARVASYPSYHILLFSGPCLLQSPCHLRFLFVFLGQTAKLLNLNPRKHTYLPLYDIRDPFFCCVRYLYIVLPFHVLYVCGLPSISFRAPVLITYPRDFVLHPSTLHCIGWYFAFSEVPLRVCPSFIPVTTPILVLPHPARNFPARFRCLHNIMPQEGRQGLLSPGDLLLDLGFSVLTVLSHKSYDALTAEPLFCSSFLFCSASYYAVLDPHFPCCRVLPPFCFVSGFSHDVFAVQFSMRFSSQLAAVHHCVQNSNRCRLISMFFQILLASPSRALVISLSMAVLERTGLRVQCLNNKKQCLSAMRSFPVFIICSCLKSKLNVGIRLFIFSTCGNYPTCWLLLSTVLMLSASIWTTASPFYYLSILGRILYGLLWVVIYLLTLCTSPGLSRSFPWGLFHHFCFFSRYNPSLPIQTLWHGGTQDLTDTFCHSETHRSCTPLKKSRLSC